jgi:hypothetical protein
VRSFASVFFAPFFLFALFFITLFAIFLLLL